MSRTIKRGTARRPVQQKRRKQPRQSIIDRIIARLPISEEMLTRIASWTIVGAVCAGVLAMAVWMGIPGAVGQAVGEGIGEAGFRINNVQITGLNRMDQDTIYKIALEQPSLAMPLVNLESTRERLVAHSGWIEDAHVSRRLPDTLLVHIVERTPAAIWQNQGHLALISANGTYLEPVRADAMPDLPLVIGEHANEQNDAYKKLLDAAPALKPMVKAATWVGNRRWNLTFETGETLVLPEGEDAAARALVKFAEMDGVQPLLNKGWIRFDMRDPTRLVARKSGDIAGRDTSEEEIKPQTPSAAGKRKVTAGQG
ncbi:cell division protein FtsQ/DivIB [Sphingomonas immobilis]|uniref:Cell division protein FtsQ n=1 Tax=Sphingomonas immobilis TaxID=3063997 RepID=A0ABT8ZXR5_9SPHN|nr:cell division protein FtsQ/DivIB [Sphingomonas sp. CA1-15]MDO7842012.1 cell division protein FtsQ/DivIB [Sphingomonas sp. CA1-15]